MKQEDILYLKSLGIELDSKLLYGATIEELIAYTREKISKVISSVEASSKEYVSLGEDGISSIIATALNQTMGLVAQRETNSRGHVDLTITAPTYASEAKFRYMGEAKIWRTKQYCIDGFEQLMGYITGRQNNSFTIIYFRTKECDRQFGEYINELLKQKGGSKLDLQGRYGLTKHVHTSTAEVVIDHYAVHLPGLPLMFAPPTLLASFLQEFLGLVVCSPRNYAV